MKCNYNGCSSKCRGDIDVESCNVLRAYNQGAKEFAEWLCRKYTRIEQDNIGFEKFQNIYWKSIDEVLAEWQKEGRI